MTALVTGATGLVGYAVARALLDAGTPVRALVRDHERAKLLPEGAEPVAGDVTDASSLEIPMKDVETVFHAAGVPESYQRDEKIFDRVNVDGTRNVLGAAKWAAVRRVVHTSTLDVFGAERHGTLSESFPDPQPKPSAYERSKVAAEKVVDEFVAEGLDVTIVNPAAVFGRAPVMTGLNAFFERGLRGGLPFVPPGGLSVVETGSLADAHLKAAERGGTGERYLIGDGYIRNVDLAALIYAELGRKPPKELPEAVLVGVTNVLDPLSRLFRFRPLLTKGELVFALWDVRIDTSKAQADLGFVPLPVEEGVRRTLAWLAEKPA